MRDGRRKSGVHAKGVVGIVIVIGFILMAVFAPVIAPYPPNQQHLLNRLKPPSWMEGGDSNHLLGTDQLGRDMLSRIIHGSRVALIIGGGGVLLAGIIGTIVGILSGYLGGWVDSAAMRLVDTIIAVPNTILYLTVLGVFKPSIWLLIAVIGFVNWTTFARVVRAETLSVKQREFIEASLAIGQRLPVILTKHVFPNIVGSILVVATLNVGGIIILEAGLSFLGFGVQPPAVTWGRMLSDGRAYLATAWWLATFPGLGITLLTVALILLGDWLRDVLDPRI